MLKKKDVLWWYNYALSDYAEYYYKVDVEKNRCLECMRERYEAQLEAYARVLVISRDKLKADKDEAVEAYVQNKRMAAI